MADFDAYRNKWFYQCPFCGSETYSFRNCGELTPCRCGKDMKLVDYKEGKHVDYEEKEGECAAVHTFKPYFDVTMNKVVESKREIREYCKRNDMVYAGDKEITQQCEQNKRENAIKLDREITEGLTEKLWSVM